MLQILTQKTKQALRELVKKQSIGGYTGQRRANASEGYEDIKRLRKAFKLIDTNNNGIIDRFELRVCLEKLRIEATASDVNQLFSMFDIDGSDGIDFSEFCSMLLGGERIEGGVTQECTRDTLSRRYRGGLLTIPDL
jgi:Ca2+-binding EF-hand superfamily protein